MSADKHRSRERQIKLLAKAMEPGGIRINCEGGIKHDDADLERLVEEGLIEIRRVRDKYSSPFGGGWIRRTRGFLTVAARGRLKA
jgi:hypothetical protein